MYSPAAQLMLHHLQGVVSDGQQLIILIRHLLLVNLLYQLIDGCGDQLVGHSILMTTQGLLA